MAKVVNWFKHTFSQVKSRFIPIKKRVVYLLERNPIKSFLALLLLLFILIAAGSAIRRPIPPAQVTKQAKTVDVYTIGSAPKVSTQAQIQKSGVITINAQTAGIIRSIAVKEGQTVKKGNNLLSLATNYQGGSAPSVQRQLAEKQYQQVSDLLPLQKDLISKQKDQAGKVDGNNDQLRDISKQSIDETNSLLSLNDDILSTLDKNLNRYEATNSAGLNDTLILSTKQMKSQFLAANNGLRTQLRNTQYQSDENKPPAQLSNITKDITLKQLDIQEKTLDLAKEISSLQVTLARVNEGTMFPASPFTGRVERIHVRVGQSVTPGMQLVTISGTVQHITAIATLPEALVSKISRLEPSIIHIGGKTFTTLPDFVSREATHGQLFSVIYTIPIEIYDPEPDGGFIRIDIPVGYADTGATVPFIPIDSVVQTQGQAFVYVVSDGKAVSKPVILGQVVGQHVEVSSGLSTGDQVILNRNVIAGEEVIKK